MTYYKVNTADLHKKDCFADATKEELRVLLAIISENGKVEDHEALSELAHTSKARASASLAFWEEAGVIKESDTAEPTVSVEYKTDDAPEESAASIAKKIKDDGLASLISECARIMDKPMLSTAETKKIVNIYSQYGLNEEYIITLAAYLKERNRLTANRLADEAESLSKKGITCTEELEIYIDKSAKLSDAEWQYKRVIGIFGRALSPVESEMAERWFSTYAYSEEIVKLAFGIATRSNIKLEISYMDAIIKNWYEKGCRTIADCTAESERFSLEWKSKNLGTTVSNQAEGPSRRKQKEKPRYGDFDVNDAFKKALERSYGSSDEEN
ncbi:MAG: DnaD domain protein [Clostridia bacterium]|nr:DnaD domain protein [Clostridia bacterium]